MAFWIDHVVFYLLVLLLGRSVELLESGGVKRVVTRPWVRREWGHSLDPWLVLRGPPNPL